MRFPRFTSPVILTIFILTTAWTVLVITAPLMVPQNTLRDLSGVVGFHDNDEQFSSLSPLPHAIYWLGDAECHQMADRSYFLNGNELPFCARDVGVFLGLVAGFGVVTFYRYKMKPWLALLGLVPIGADGGLQLITNYESTNPLRVTTGFVAGVALALLLAHFLFVLREDKAGPTPTVVPPIPEKQLHKT